jgi:predicted metal-dependent hydrolase
MSDTTRLRVGDVSVELRLSPKRRTVALRVGPGGAVLYAPVGVGTERLQRFLREREAWLLGHLAAFARSERPALAEGSVLPLLGETLTLQLSPGLRAARREGQSLSADPLRLHDQLEAWYSRAALAHFEPLVERLTLDLGQCAPRHTPLAAVRLTRASGRWGSCTASGEIRLHWRLMLAPEQVARYVAAHEVAHLAQMNHSARYWATLERLMPGYPEPKRWLKEHGESLTLWD